MPKTLSCPDCGRPVSTRAAFCLFCGRRHPHPNPVYRKAFGVGCLVFLVIGGACLAFILIVSQP